MTFRIRKLVGTAILAAVTMTGARAQAPVPDGPRYVIAYLEVMPTAANEGAALAREMRDAMRREAGSLRGEALQRIGRPNQIVILSAWKDQAALDAHAKVNATRAPLPDSLRAPGGSREDYEYNKTR
jgi:quinol monooxygenase YgiN